jgi:hypothetical protein
MYIYNNTHQNVYHCLQSWNGLGGKVFYQDFAFPKPM